MIFYRSNFTKLWINIRSNEQLGLLDFDYVEDYDGADGYISLYHVESAIRHSVPVLPVENRPNTYTAALDLENLPDGLYELQFRVRDKAGNFTIVGAHAQARGNERTISATLEIRPGEAERVMMELGIIELIGEVRFDTDSHGQEVVFNNNGETTTFNIHVDRNHVFDIQFDRSKVI